MDSDEDDGYQPSNRDMISSLFKENYTTLSLKKDAFRRPLWVCHDARIILEAFSPLRNQAVNDY
jgi:DNA excision repair protein ERCC-3